MSKPRLLFPTKTVVYRTAKKLLLIVFPACLMGCGAYFNQPTGPENARIGELTPKSRILENLPPPQEPVVVGVYNFKDQTGQYKDVEGGSTFSTAVPQGATTILIKALEDSKWFTPIERENLANLLNERNIIRSTREEYRKNNQPNQPSLTPLLFAGILLEGGVISYDTNIVTGGLGARYFGIGASTQYRQDRITIYLRAVSTSNGKILKTVYISKTILSQAIDGSLFKFVKFQRLLEAETGFTKNEPVQLAMKDAIEGAVESLIIEGIEDGLWYVQEGDRRGEVLVDEYRKMKAMEEDKKLYDRKQLPIAHNQAIGFRLVSPLLYGDLSDRKIGFGGTVGYYRSLTPHLKLNVGASLYNFKGGRSLSRNFLATDFNLEVDMLPYDNFGPFVYGGAGLLFNKNSDNGGTLVNPSTTAKIQAGLGVSLKFTSSLDVRFFAEADYSFTDRLDGIENGKRDDYFYTFGFGLRYNFGNVKQKIRVPKP